jgi:nucleotide-binding universal stress UspA family protein
VQPVLICYDGSDSAAHSFGVAAELLSERTAVVVDVGPVVTGAENLGVLPGSGVATIQKEYLEAASEGASRGAELARQAGFDAEPRGELACETWDGIRDVANDLDAAVIVIGSRGLRGVRELFESVSREVVEHSGRPVLIVPDTRRRSQP